MDGVLHGEGVRLRPWRDGDQPVLEEILTVSREAFSDWLPGVIDDLADLDAFLAHVSEASRLESGWYFAVEVDGEVVGQCSLTRSAPGVGEIGYWVRSDRTGAGIAPRAVRTVTKAASGYGFDVLVIHCDAGNDRSVAVASNAGFVHVGTVELDPSLPRTRAQTGSEMTWERRSDHNNPQVLQIRPRAPDDIGACIAIARETHQLDGYPIYWPVDPQRFISPPHELARWVAEYNDQIVGHVALHRAASDPTFQIAQQATGMDADHLVVAGRLFTSVDHRRRGLGRALLASATNASHTAGQVPVLDVGKELHAAVALYEAVGWRRVGEFTLTLIEGDLDLWVYVGPPPNDAV